MDKKGDKASYEPDSTPVYLKETPKNDGGQVLI